MNPDRYPSDVSVYAGLVAAGIISTQEFRSWLISIDPKFAQAVAQTKEKSE